MSKESPLISDASDSSLFRPIILQPRDSSDRSVNCNPCLETENQTPSYAVQLPHSNIDTKDKVIVKGKVSKGEITTVIAILNSHNEDELRLFKDNVVVLSQTITAMHPLIFAGPRDGLCKCSMRSGMFIFQYAQFFEQYKQVSCWNTSDQPYSIYAFLLQVFLTLKAALEVELLPTHMSEWKYVLISRNGSVMIDIVNYLSMNFNKPKSSMFSDKCDHMITLCTSMMEIHLPNSELCAWLQKCSHDISTSCLLTTTIQWLRTLDQSERTIPSLLSLQGNYFTFKDYSADMPNWLTHLGEQEDARERSNAKQLVYGDPKPFRGNQTAEAMCDTNLTTLTKNIVLRMRAKVFGSTRLQVTAMDCTRGLMKVTLSYSALSRVSSIDHLDSSLLQCKFDGATNYVGSNLAIVIHDAVSQESKWAPVIMLVKCKENSPLPAFTIEYYKITILVVTLSEHGSVDSVTELFKSTDLFSVADY